MAHTFSKQLTPGTPENVNDVMTNFNEGATDWEFAFAAYKTIERRAGVSPTTPGAVTYAIPLSGSLTQVGTGAGQTLDTHVLYLDPADYTAATRTTKLRVRAQLSTNSTALTTNLTVGLYPVSAFFAASGNLQSVGAVTAGSTVTFTAPGASTQTQANSGDFTAPSAGYYIMAVANSGASATNSVATVIVELQMRQV